MPATERMARLRARQRADQRLLAALLADRAGRRLAHKLVEASPDLAEGVSDGVSDALRGVSDGVSDVTYAPVSTHAGTSRSTAPVTTTTNTKRLPPPPSPGGPSKSGEVIDRLRAGGFRGNLSPKDHLAIKRSDLSPAEIVEAFGAVSRGEWDNPWLRTNLSVEAVISRYAAFEALRRFPGVRPGGAARKSTGTRILEELGFVGE